MNILAFSLEWFKTPPGILITAGVVLLVIALIMFIVTSVKSKKGAKEEVPATNPVQAPAAPQQWL